MHPKILWPNNKKFAFTIFDDTDRANLKDIQSVYECLDELGFKTTKSVWVIKGNRPHESSGVTCDDKMYVNWLLGLKDKLYSNPKSFEYVNARLLSLGCFRIQFGTKTISLYFLIDFTQEQK